VKVLLEIDVNALSGDVLTMSVIENSARQRWGRRKAPGIFTEGLLGRRDLGSVPDADVADNVAITPVRVLT